MATIQDRSLLVLVLDLTPKTWGQRDQIREISDKSRRAQDPKKRSNGPATLKETISAILSFLIAFISCHRDNTVIIIGVAGSDISVLHPRKDRMDSVVGITALDSSKDLVEMREGLMLGVAELVGRCVENTSESDPSRGTAIAAATSLGLCLINRIMKSSTSGDLDNDNNGLLHRKEDEGILGMISNKLNKEGEGATNYATEQRLAQRRAKGLLSPRVLIVQASEDCTLDYNAFMNCVFAANKSDVVIDACFMPSLGKDIPHTSTFLQQACDRTGGIFSRPVGASQVNGGLTEVFMTVFLPPLGIRKELNLPKVTKVDFRARCFETGGSLDIGFVCNLCLSIFKNEPKCGDCLTCGAKILVKDTDPATDSDGNKQGDYANENDRNKKARIE